MNTIRAFLAVNLPVRQIEAVRKVQDQLRQRARDAQMKVVWVPPPNMHVTLKFLAEIPAETASSIRDVLHPVLEKEAGLQLEVGGLGVFPSPDKPRVLWVGIESGAERLADLARIIDTELSELGFLPEKREFHPHLTLGRVKKSQGLGELFDGLEQSSFGGCSVHEVVLYESVLQRTGAEYKPLARVPLAARMTRPTGDAENKEKDEPKG